MSRPDPSTCSHRFDEGNPRRCALCDWDFTQGDPPDLSAASAVRSEGVANVLGNENDLHSVAHALDIGGIGTPYRAYQGSLYCDYQPHRIADFQDYGLALAATVLFNNAKAIKAALTSPVQTREETQPPETQKLRKMLRERFGTYEDGIREAAQWHYDQGDLEEERAIDAQASGDDATRLLYQLGAISHRKYAEAILALLSQPEPKGDKT